MANRVDQFGPVQSIEVKLIDAVLTQLLHLLDGHIRGDHAARIRIILQSVEAAAQPIRHAGAAARGEAQQLRKARDGQDAGDDVDLDASRRAAIAIAQEQIRLEEELGDGAAGTGVDLALEILHFGVKPPGFRMAFRVGRDGHFKIAHLA